MSTIPIIRPAAGPCHILEESSSGPRYLIEVLHALDGHGLVPASVAVRALVLGGPTASFVYQSLAWTVGILAVCAPLAVWRYRRLA